MSYSMEKSGQSHPTGFEILVSIIISIYACYMYFFHVFFILRPLSMLFRVEKVIAEFESFRVSLFSALISSDTNMSCGQLY